MASPTTASQTTTVSSDRLAEELLEVVPLVMRTIRAELRRRQDGSLSLAEYRVLVYLRDRSDVSLSELADHIGLGLPSMSKMVDGLVAGGLVNRAEAAEDRRRLALCLTEAGAETIRDAVAGTQATLAQIAASLSAGQREQVSGALGVLRSLFARPDYADRLGKVSINHILGERDRG